MLNTYGPDTNGTISIFDAKGFTFRQLLKIISNATSGTHFIQYGQEAICNIVRQTHVINCSWIATKGVSFFKPFLSKEVRENMHFHTNIETLHDFVSKDYLPVEYGGNEGSLDEYAESSFNNLRKHRDFLINSDNFFILND
jgi:hypothetical protein